MVKASTRLLRQQTYKKLRKLAGGDTYTIIYLKMQLLAIKTNGVLTWTGLENTVAEELALDLDESPDDVAVTLTYLTNCGLCETSDNINFFFPYVCENTGAESPSAQRVRDFRSRQKALQCNTDVTDVKRSCNVEIEKEKDIEIDKKEKEEKKNSAPLRSTTPKNVMLFNEKFADRLPTIRETFLEWLTYKNSPGNQKLVYSEIGLKKLISEVEQHIVTDGEDFVKGAIEHSIGQGWKGIIWDAYQKINPAKPKTTVATKSAIAYNNRYTQREYSQEDFEKIEKELFYESRS